MKMILSQDEVVRVQAIIKGINRKEVTKQWNAICKGEDHCSVQVNGDQFIFDLNDELSEGLLVALTTNAREIGKINKTNAILSVPKVAMSIYKIVADHLT